jgi:4-amino-4-deoxy-L-arabinose transferase-like glycosyltransferase
MLRQLKNYKTNLFSAKSAVITIKIFIFIILAYFPFFIHLGNLPIRIWDEARVAINAYEMSRNGNFLISFFNGVPDMWNTKPPLLLWMQVFFIKLFGAGEVQIRLPSAIAGFLTAGALMFFSIKFIKDYWFGLISVLVLITTYGYINVHVTRTGDYDSLLVFFTTVYAFSFFLFVESGNKKYLHLFFLAILLSILTKSIQGLLFLPAIFIYLIIRNKLKLLITKWIFINTLLCIGIILIYYFAREYYNPGFLKAVWVNELGGRYATTIEGHTGSYTFYYDWLITNHFSNWYWLVPCGIAAGFLIKNPSLKKAAIYSTLLASSYLLVISFSGTKLPWYDAPMFPFLAVIVAMIIYLIFRFLKNSHEIKAIFTFNILPYIFLFAVFLTPYEMIISKIYFPKEIGVEKSFFEISYYLRDALKSKHDVRSHYICFDGYNTHLLFYVNLLNEDNKFVEVKDWRNLKNGDLVVSSQSNVQEFIEDKYLFEITESYHTIKKYKIYGFRKVN